MKFSNFFIPTSKNTPADAEIISHQLMIRSGMIKQSSAGIYSWLPLGLKVLKKIEEIIREEQNSAGAIEILMPTIQSADLWIDLILVHIKICQKIFIIYSGNLEMK